ncbi:MAG: proline racemase family protein [Acidobacteriota bacterium]
MLSMEFVDSHTAGEPTRVILSGGPNLGSGPLSERLRRLARDHDAFRSAVIHEPRGSDVLVGALLLEPHDPACAAGVIYFNNTGYLGMCGHGTIGLVATLAYLGRLGTGQHRIETPVGTVRATLHKNAEISIENVPSYRFRKGVRVPVPGIGTVCGDVAWGGNWFFLAEGAPVDLTPANSDKLTEYAWAIRRALQQQRITGAEGAEIDHIEISASSVDADSRNFVLCPGKAYDRSPCGTGTSAKLACLAADGKLAPGEIWRQEGILGTAFTGCYRLQDGSGGRIVPSITGRAYVTAKGYLLLEPEDPFRDGIRL